MLEIENMNLESTDLVTERIDALKALFPEILTEGEGAIDFDKLRLILGDDVDDGSERYAFTWPGKAAAIRQSQTTSNATLRPCIAKSRGRDGEDGSFDSDNIYIEGDNLEVLKLLFRSYHGEINVIYIDPPYNTGNDFVYHDKFGDTVQNYKEQLGLVGQASVDTSGRFHSDWCSMMYPRLRLARELLADDGVLLMSVDDVEVANLRKLADEIMGPSNFVAQIIWAGGRKNDSKYISVSHEYVICYAKSIDYLKNNAIRWRKKKTGLEDIYAKVDELNIKWGVDYVAMSKELRRWYRSLAENHPSKAHMHYSSIDKAGVYFPDNISWPGGGGPKYQVLHPVTGNPVSIPSGGWRFSDPKRMDELIQEGRIEFGDDESKVPCYKRYLKETETEVPYSVIYKDGRAASKRLASLMGARVFDNPKDEYVIADLLSYIDRPDSIILDFFSGSGTTAHSVMLRNLQDGGKRKYILVQLPEDLNERLRSTVKTGAKQVIQNAISLCDDLRAEPTICAIAEERIRRAGAEIVNSTNGSADTLDIGFRVFSLADSGIQKPEPNQLLGDVVRADRDHLDIVFEMMLKWGLDLTLSVDEVYAAGYPVWSVARNELVCCTSEGLNLDVLEAVASMQPRRVLILDSILTDTLKLNAIEIFKHAGKRAGREIELRTI